MDDLGNAFSFPDLWKTSALADLDQPLEHIVPFKLVKEIDLRLPTLSELEYGPIETEELLALETLSASSGAESHALAERDEEDVWSFPSPIEKTQKEVQQRSWESFYDKPFLEPRTVYISEGGPRSFDAVLAARVGNSDGEHICNSDVIIQSHPLFDSLLRLGLGRESVLYHYSEDKQSFHPLIENGRMSGYSLEAFQQLSLFLIDVGNKFRDLRAFIEMTLSSACPIFSRIAMAASFQEILPSLEARLSDSSTKLCSLLQLRLTFGKSDSVLTCLSRIVRDTRDLSTDEEILSRIYEINLDSEHSASWLRSLMLQILATVSKPWLDRSSDWLGLEVDSTFTLQRQRCAPSFVKIAESIQKSGGRNEMEVYEYEYEPQKMPSFVSKDDGLLMFETGQSLRILEAHQPEHPLLGAVSLNASRLSGLEWQFSWKDVERAQAQAQKYESELKYAIQYFDLHGKNEEILQKPNDTLKQIEENECKFMSQEKAKAYISASISVIEKPLPQIRSKSDSLSPNIQCLPDYSDIYDEEIFTPPTSLLPILSFNPLISAQSRLSNRACFRMLFKKYNLRFHLRLLHQFSLFGDGVFTSRLSHALFDPELQTAERRKGYSRSGTSGLKLGFRDTWPPASSELRLALMGILSDSFRQSQSLGGSSPVFGSELPGGLSFSIREMSEEELQRCVNPDSIEALDFLRLDYRPPPPLDTVITQTSLLKYDAVFKHLLRSTRMLFVVNQMFQDTQASSLGHKSVCHLMRSFRIESHHFVSALCNYFYEGVRMNWAKLEKKLEDVENDLTQDSVETLSNLRDFHERVMDRMMFALILRKRQRQVMKLVEEIFGLVLQFAKHVRFRVQAALGLEMIDDEIDLRKLHERFRKKVRVFVSVCQGLSERRGQGGSMSQPTHEEQTEDGGSSVGHLLLKLDINGFYGTY